MNPAFRVLGLAASLAAVAQGAKVKFRYGTQVGHHVAQNGDVNSRVAVKSPVYKSVFSLSGEKITSMEAPSFFSSSFLFTSKRFIAVSSGMAEKCIVRTAVGFFSENETVPTRSADTHLAGGNPSKFSPWQLFKKFRAFFQSNEGLRPERGTGNVFRKAQEKKTVEGLHGYSWVPIGNEKGKREWIFQVVADTSADHSKDISFVECREEYLRMGSSPTVVVSKDSNGALQCNIDRGWTGGFVSGWWRKVWASVGKKPSWQYQPNLLEGVTVEMGDFGVPMFVRVVTAEATKACGDDVKVSEIGKASLIIDNPLPAALEKHAHYYKRLSEGQKLEDLEYKAVLNNIGTVAAKKE